MFGPTVSPQLVQSGKGRIASDPALLNLPRPLMVGAFLRLWQQRTNLWRERTNLRTGSERPSGRSALRCGLSPQRRASGPRPARIPVWPGSLSWQRRTNLWRERTCPSYDSISTKNVAKLFCSEDEARAEGYIKAG